MDPLLNCFRKMFEAELLSLKYLLIRGESANGLRYSFEKRLA
jgi:hypothetical protein